MNEVQRLTAGTAAFLQYEFCCMRANLFSEAHLTGAIANILQSLHGGLTSQLISGYKHPVLTDLKKKGGRRPEIDYVVAAYDDQYSDQRQRPQHTKTGSTLRVDLFTTAVETKWAGSSHCTISNILWDLLRLEMLTAVNPKVNAYFLIAGHMDKLAQLRTKDGLENLIPFVDGPHALALTPASDKNESILTSFFQAADLQDLDVPHGLTVTPCLNAAMMVQTSKMQAIAWKVQSFQLRSTFKPSNYSQYRHEPRSSL